MSPEKDPIQNALTSTNPPEKSTDPRDEVLTKLQDLKKSIETFNNTKDTGKYLPNNSHFIEIEGKLKELTGENEFKVGGQTIQEFFNDLSIKNSKKKYEVANDSIKDIKTISGLEKIDEILGSQLALTIDIPGTKNSLIFKPEGREIALWESNLTPDDSKKSVLIAGLYEDVKSKIDNIEKIQFQQESTEVNNNTEIQNTPPGGVGLNSSAGASASNTFFDNLLKQAGFSSRPSSAIPTEVQRFNSPLPGQTGFSSRPSSAGSDISGEKSFLRTSKAFSQTRHQEEWQLKQPKPIVLGLGRHGGNPLKVAIDGKSVRSNNQEYLSGMRQLGGAAKLAITSLEITIGGGTAAAAAKAAATAIARAAAQDVNHTPSPTSTLMPIVPSDRGGEDRWRRAVSPSNIPHTPGMGR